MKIVIVGAVAGGASAAARARRLDENAEIILFERGEAPSFANCGLPYYVGGVIDTRDKLLVAPKQRLIDRYRLDVRTRTEVLSINRHAKRVHVRDLESGAEFDEFYDKLILSPGAVPIRPPLPGANLPNVFTLRELRDADQLLAVTANAKSAVVIGAGFIGMEMTENLVRRKVETTIVEHNNQVLPPWDAEMVSPIAEHLREHGVQLRPSDAAEAIEPSDGRLLVQLRSGKQVLADLVVLSVGVRPENKLALEAGLNIGARGGIQVNEHQQTSDPDIYAVGDAIEVRHFIDGSPTQIPLGGPANRQGRIAANHIFGRSSQYRGTQGTAIVGVFEMTAAMTGFSEKYLRATSTPFQKIYVHPAQHAGYFPGAEQLSIKLLFAPENGKILGAQVVGRSGVDKRIDVLAVAIQAGMTAFDLEEMELAYAPQYGSAKDPVNMAGFVAAGVLNGDHPIAHADELQDRANSFIVDVRSPEEYSRGSIPGAVNIPIEELRNRSHELPREKQIVTYCQVGQRGYLATRLLMQRDFDVANLSGGYTTYSQVTAARRSCDQV